MFFHDDHPCPGQIPLANPLDKLELIKKQADVLANFMDEDNVGGKKKAEVSSLRGII